MRSQTRERRAINACEIVKKRPNRPTTINEWLEIINDELPGQQAVRNTKELGHMFRYMSKVLKLPIERERPIDGIQEYRATNIYYTYKTIEVQAS